MTLRRAQAPGGGGMGPQPLSWPPCPEVCRAPRERVPEEQPSSPKVRKARSTRPRCTRSPAVKIGRVKEPSCSSVRRVTSSNAEAACRGARRLTAWERPKTDIDQVKLSMDLVSSRTRVSFLASGRVLRPPSRRLVAPPLPLPEHRSEEHRLARRQHLTDRRLHPCADLGGDPPHDP